MDFIKEKHILMRTAPYTKENGLKVRKEFCMATIVISRKEMEYLSSLTEQYTKASSRTINSTVMAD